MRNWCCGTQVGNRKILGQDKRVVITQHPKKTALRMEEKLIQGDRPIIEYRRRRPALQDGKNFEAARLVGTLN